MYQFNDFAHAGVVISHCTKDIVTMLGCDITVRRQIENVVCCDLDIRVQGEVWK